MYLKHPTISIYSILTKLVTPGAVERGSLHILRWAQSESALFAEDRLLLSLEQGGRLRGEALKERPPWI